MGKRKNQTFSFSDRVFSILNIDDKYFIFSFFFSLKANFRPTSIVFIMFVLDLGGGNCKPTSITDQSKTTGSWKFVSKVVPLSRTNHSAHSTVNRQTALPVIPSSTEYTSAEITTRSAENLGPELLEIYRRRSEDLKIATNALFNDMVCFISTFRTNEDFIYFAL